MVSFCVAFFKFFFSLFASLYYDLFGTVFILFIFLLFFFFVIYSIKHLMWLFSLFIIQINSMCCWSQFDLFYSPLHNTNFSFIWCVHLSSYFKENKRWAIVSGAIGLYIHVTLPLLISFHNFSLLMLEQKTKPQKGFQMQFLCCFYKQRQTDNRISN